jgi:hypothetical protein
MRDGFVFPLRGARAREKLNVYFCAFNWGFCVLIGVDGEMNRSKGEEM